MKYLPLCSTLLTYFNNTQSQRGEDPQGSTLEKNNGIVAARTRFYDPVRSRNKMLET